MHVRILGIRCWWSSLWLNSFLLFVIIGGLWIELINELNEQNSWFFKLGLKNEFSKYVWVWLVYETNRSQTSFNRVNDELILSSLIFLYYISGTVRAVVCSRLVRKLNELRKDVQTSFVYIKNWSQRCFFTWAVWFVYQPYLWTINYPLANLYFLHFSKFGFIVWYFDEVSLLRECWDWVHEPQR